MGGIASMASVLGAGASVYGNLRAAQLQQANNQAQLQVTQQQNQLRQRAILSQAQQDALARQQQLAQTVDAARAQLGGAGIVAQDGSAAAVEGGAVQRARAAQEAADAATRAQLAQGQISLLQPDSTATTLLQNAPAFGFASRSLLA
jgi:hypothetical protein